MDVQTGWRAGRCTYVRMYVCSRQCKAFYPGVQRDTTTKKIQKPKNDARVNNRQESKKHIMQKKKKKVVVTAELL